MFRKIEVKVVSYDPNTLMARAVDPTEIDDVVFYDLWAPAHFGGATNPYPKVGENLVLRYDTSGMRSQQPIAAVWRPHETAHA